MRLHPLARITAGFRPPFRTFKLNSLPNKPPATKIPSGNSSNMPVAVPPTESAASQQQPDIVGLLREAVIPLPPLQDNNADKSFSFAGHFDAFADCKVLLIGDGTHGTSEFYAARAEITKYMIENHGFNIVATEADWPDAEAVDRYVRRRRGPGVPAGSGSDPTADPPVKSASRDRPFSRFPTWMWRNLEVHDFVAWLRAFNKGRKVKDAVGYYGLDLYSMGASMRAVISYLDHVDGKMARAARKGYGRLMPWAEHPHEYGLQALHSSFKGYEKDVLEILRGLLIKRIEYSSQPGDGDEFHSSEQNARLVAGKSSIRLPADFEKSRAPRTQGRVGGPTS